MLRVACSSMEIEMIDENDGLIYHVYVHSPSKSPNQVSLDAPDSDIHSSHSTNIYWVHTVSHEF